MMIEERGYSMITDKQGREWLFQKLHDDGYRYYVMDSYGDVYLTNEMPPKEYITNELKVGRCKKAINALRFKNMLPELKRNECISIAEELGIVDWLKVAVDTPILVKGLGLAEWQNRYFAFFKDGEVYAWCNGATSWSCKNSNDVSSWNYVKLAEV